MLDKLFIIKGLRFKHNEFCKLKQTYHEALFFIRNFIAHCCWDQQL